VVLAAVGVVAALLFGFLVYRLGLDLVLYGPAPETPESESRDSVAIPADILEALIEAGAVVANAANPTRARPHDTFLVRPDPELTFRLKPSVHVQGHVLPATEAWNLDPPVLYWNGAREMSGAVRAWVESGSRLAFDYRTEPDGLRRTVPAVSAERKILMVGDSVMFGVGVSDEWTPASTLQQRLGDGVQVVNAGAGRYQAWQALEAARRMGETGGFEALVYLTSQNDFVFHRDETWPRNAEEIVEAFAGIKPLFGGRVVLLVLPYLEVTVADLLREKGWKPGTLRKSEALFEALPALCEAAGLEYVDYMRFLEAFRGEAGTIFAPFALFVDHAHPSPLASRRLAALLAERLQVPTDRSPR
jgi:lysophospholipase L1-like esterase